MHNLQSLQDKAKLIRKWCLISTTEAGSGHTTTALSAVDICTVLFDKYLRFDIKNPKNLNNDKFILSKGHGSPLLYALFAVAYGLPLNKLKTLRKFGSILEGHPNPRFPFADVATGSLGQGLSVGAGIALSLRSEIRNSKFEIRNCPKVYVLLGDGEMAEGNVWEAANFASYYKLNNLIAIIDVNRLGQSQETMFGHNLEEYIQRLNAFGWEVLAIDGHNFEEIDRAFNLALNNKSEKPFVIIAKTIKGKGVSIFEDKEGWHGKPLKREELEKALTELGEVDDGLRFKLRAPAVRSDALVAHDPAEPDVVSPRLRFNYKIGDQIGTREVYGEVLGKLADNNPFIFALDGDVKNSTYSQDFKKAHPDRFIECFIAEQNMVGVALGLWAMGKVPFVSTFAAFLTRAFDQIRMSVISKGNIKFVGSHAGVSIGEDGPSQMGLEDIAMFGAFPDSIVLHPSDAVSTTKLLTLLVAHKGIAYLRTLRPKTAVLYDLDEAFPIGGSKILRQSKKDILTIAACGITVHEALKAYEMLKNDGIYVRVIDCYCVKPIDRKTLQQSSNATMKQLVITVEDHFEHGGLGDFILAALADSKTKVVKMAVTNISTSGTSAELLDAAGISAKHIVKKVKSFL